MTQKNSSMLHVQQYSNHIHRTTSCTMYAATQEHNTITIEDKDNRTAISFIQHQIWHNHQQHMHVTLPHQQIHNIPSAKHYVNSLIHSETGASITSYEKLVNVPLATIRTKAMAMEPGYIAQGHNETIHQEQTLSFSVTTMQSKSNQLLERSHKLTLQGTTNFKNLTKTV